MGEARSADAVRETSLLALLEYLPSLLQGFAAFDNTELDAAIDHVLARLGTVARVDRTYLFLIRQLPDGRAVLDNTQEWCARGISPQRDELQQLPLAVIDHWLPAFHRGEAVHVPSVAALDPDRPDREVLTAQGIRSLLSMPLIAAGELIGFIGFDAVRFERSWSPGEQLLLRAVSDAVCSALLRQEALRELSERERRYRLLARHSADLVVTLDARGRFRELSPSAAALLGWTTEALAGSRPADHVHPDDVPSVTAALSAALQEPGAEVRLPDYRLRHLDGSWRWLQSTAIDLRHEPAVGGLIVVGHDISERKAAESALAHAALHDPLTGLPNRTLLLDRLQQALGRRRRGALTVAVVFLDLDRFKTVNDRLGHGQGDHLLRAYAERLARAVRTGDTVARFGGDEFVVVLDEVADAEEAWAITERLLAILEQPFDLGGTAHRITSSAGLVMARDDLDAHLLLRDADTAMYQAKASGRRRIRTLDERLREALLDEADLARELHRLEESDELSVAYQPIFSLADGACVGYEALARWHHPTRGNVPPDRFIPLAEEHGAIGAIGSAVLTRAVSQLQAWDAEVAGHDDRFMAVNLSVRQLIDERLVTRISGVLEERGLAPSRLQLELTESALMAEPRTGRRVLDALRELGVGVAIDDFGTGYSSLAYLRELPVTSLKIDRSFVAAMGHEARDARVVAVVLNLAREFGLRSVAEGIESEAQRTQLAHLGCDLGQGYGLARPGAPDALAGSWFLSPTSNGALG